MAIVFISLLGGKIANFWSDRRFNRKWETYRKIAADEIDAVAKKYYLNTLLYLSTHLKSIAEKSDDEISHIDFEIFNRHRDEVIRGLGFVDKIFESYHFCLRETDVRRGQHFVVAAKPHLRHLQEKLHSPLENFGVMLGSHLQGRYLLSEELRPLNCTRHQFMLACAIAVENILKNPLNDDVLNRLSIFTNGLRKPGAAKPDSRELRWLAEPLPALPDGSTATASAKATE